MQSNTHTRKTYFDIAKGIGIILVVLGHISYLSTPLRDFIVSFHMPLFFVISGMLMYITSEENRTFSEYFKGKKKRIIRPYICYSIIYILIEIVSMLVLNKTEFMDWFNFYQNIWITVCLYGNSVLWFLPTLLFAGLIFYFVRKHCSHGVTVILVVALMIITYVLNNCINTFIYDNALILNIYVAELHIFCAGILRCIFAVFFLFVGYYAYHIYKKYIFEHVKQINPLIYTAVAILLLISVVFLSQINGTVDFHYLSFNNPAIFIYNSVVGSFAVIILAKSLEFFSEKLPVRILRFYGVNSLTVMATHIDFYVMYVANIVALLILKFLPVYGDGIICCLMLPMVLIGEVFVVFCVNTVSKR